MIHIAAEMAPVAKVLASPIQNYQLQCYSDLLNLSLKGSPYIM